MNHLQNPLHIVLFILAGVLAAGCSPVQVSAGDGSATASASYISTIPSPFHGVWTHEPSGIHPRNSELPMVVSPSKVEGHEWTCDHVSVKSNNPNDITVLLQGYGEGQPLSVHERWILSADGSSMRVIKLGDYPGTDVLYRARGWNKSQSAYGD